MSTYKKTEGLMEGIVRTDVFRYLDNHRDRAIRNLIADIMRDLGRSRKEVAQLVYEWRASRP